MRAEIDFDPAATADIAKANAFKTGVVTALHLPTGVTGADVHFAFAEVVVAEAEPAADAGGHRRLTAAAAGDCLAIPDKANIGNAIEAAYTDAGVTATVDVTHAAETHMELESSAHLGASLSAAVMTVLLVASRG